MARKKAKYRSRAVSAKGILAYKPKITRSLPAGSIIECADNSGAKKLRVIAVYGYKGRLKRVPSACVGDQIVVSIRKGAPGMKKQIFAGIVIRQKKQYRRKNGTWIGFEDNAAVIVTPEGKLKGSKINGPVALEAAELWPRIASSASIIV